MTIACIQFRVILEISTVIMVTLDGTLVRNVFEVHWFKFVAGPALLRLIPIAYLRVARCMPMLIERWK